MAKPIEAMTPAEAVVAHVRNTRAEVVAHLGYCMEKAHDGGALAAFATAATRDGADLRWGGDPREAEVMRERLKAFERAIKLALLGGLYDELEPGYTGADAVNNIVTKIAELKAQ